MNTNTLPKGMVYDKSTKSYKIIRMKHGKRKYYGGHQSYHEAMSMYNKLEANGWKKPILVRPRHTGKWKHITKTKNGYRIQKNSFHYGIFATFEEAYKYKQYLEDHDWDKKLAYRKRGKYNPHRYISVNRGVNPYHIVKRIDGRLEYFGCFPTMEEAMAERDFLESINWDWDLIYLY